MNRSDFLKTLGLGALTLPALLEAASDPRRRTLIEWLDDVRREQPKATVICGSDALEYFREKYSAKATDGRGLSQDFGVPNYRFSCEQIPYRYTEEGYLVNPYFETMTDRGRAHQLNPAWIYASTEVCIAYGGSTVFYAPFDRKTFVLL